MPHIEQRDRTSGNSRIKGSVVRRSAETRRFLAVARVAKALQVPALVRPAHVQRLDVIDVSGRRTRTFGRERNNHNPSALPGRHGVARAHGIRLQHRLADAVPCGVVAIAVAQPSEAAGSGSIRGKNRGLFHAKKGSKSAQNRPFLASKGRGEAHF